MNENQLQALVYRAIDRVNELLLEEHSLPRAGGTILLGPGTTLDSMGFVNFVVGLEEELSAAGLNISLVAELNAAGGWVVTVNDLARFLAGLIQKQSMGPISNA